MHYEGLLFASRKLSNVGGPRHIKVLYAILFVLTLHVVEIWIFGAALWMLLQWPACGSITSAIAGSPGTPGLFDSVYFSAMTYSTVGLAIWFRSDRYACLQAPRAWSALC